MRKVVGAPGAAVDAAKQVCAAACDVLVPPQGTHAAAWHVWVAELAPQRVSMWALATDALQKRDNKVYPCSFCRLLMAVAGVVRCHTDQGAG